MASNSLQIWVAAMGPDSELLAASLGPPTDASAELITAAMDGGLEPRHVWDLWQTEHGKYVNK